MDASWTHEHLLSFANAVFFLVGMNENLNTTKRKVRGKSSNSDKSQSSSPIAKKPKEIDIFSPNHEEPEGLADSSLASIRQRKLILS